MRAGYIRVTNYIGALTSLLGCPAVLRSDFQGTLDTLGGEVNALRDILSAFKVSSPSPMA